MLPTDPKMIWAWFFEVHNAQIQRRIQELQFPRGKNMFGSASWKFETGPWLNPCKNMLAIEIYIIIYIYISYIIYIYIYVYILLWFIVCSKKNVKPTISDAHLWCSIILFPIEIVFCQVNLGKFAGQIIIAPGLIRPGGWAVVCGYMPGIIYLQNIIIVY